MTWRFTSRRRLLAILAGLLCLSGLAIAADLILVDRKGSGVQKPTQALAEKFGKTDVRVSTAPWIELEQVVDDMKPLAEWTVSPMPFWAVPGMRLEEATCYVVTPAPTAENPAATKLVSAPAPGFTLLTFPGQDADTRIVKGFPADIGKRMAMAAGTDYVQIVFDAK